MAGKAWREHSRETLLLAATRTGVENEINRAGGLQHHTRPRGARQAGCALQAGAKLTIDQVVKKDALLKEDWKLQVWSRRSPLAGKDWVKVLVDLHI